MSTIQSSSLVNPELISMALASLQGLSKQAFIPGGGGPTDPPGGAGAGAGAGPGGPPPVDPSAGVAPPMGPMDPTAGMGPPPPPQAAASGMQPAMQSVEPIKPKIDVNVTLLQILKMLARIADALHVPIPASEMVATQGDLTQMGMQQQDGSAGAGAPGGGASPQSAIPPISPVAPAAPGMGKMSNINNGEGYDTSGFNTLGNRAAAIAHIRHIRAA